MMKSELHEVVGYYLLQPIASMLEQIENARPEVLHFHSPKYLENSFSASIIPLIVTLIDSFVHWSLFFIKREQVEKSPIRILLDDYQENDLANQIDELFMVRHAIVHAHVWSREIGISFDRNIDYSDFELRKGYGNKLFRNIVDLTTGRTRILGINVIPTRISRSDIKLSLEVLNNLLTIIENKIMTQNEQSQNLLNLSGQFVVYKGQVVRFVDMLRQFTND
ncbi:hypothetical protein AB6A23_08695 [Paenibacillus tarimensis]